MRNFALGLYPYLVEDLDRLRLSSHKDVETRTIMDAKHEIAEDFGLPSLSPFPRSEIQVFEKKGPQLDWYGFGSMCYDINESLKFGGTVHTKVF